MNVKRSMAVICVALALVGSSSIVIAAPVGKHTDGRIASAKLHESTPSPLCGTTAAGGWAPACIVYFDKHGNNLSPPNPCANGPGSTPWCAPPNANDMEIIFGAHDGCNRGPGGGTASPPVLVMWTLNGQLEMGNFAYMPCKARGFRFNWNSKCQILSAAWTDGKGNPIKSVTPWPGANDAHIVNAPGMKIKKVIWTRDGRPIGERPPAPPKPPASTGWGN